MKMHSSCLLIISAKFRTSLKLRVFLLLFSLWGLQGLQAQDFDWLIPPKYDAVDYIAPYKLYYAKKNEIYSIYDTTGTLMSEGWENFPLFREDGFAPVKKEGKWGLIRQTGAIFLRAYADSWHTLIDFSEGLCQFVGEDGKMGFVDTLIKVIVKPIFEEVDKFSEGLAGVKQHGKWGFIDKTGKVIIEPIFEKVDKFSEGLAGVKQHGKWGFINKAGKIVVTPAFTIASEFSEGLVGVGVQKDGNYKCSLIDNTGKIVAKVDTNFWDVDKFSEGLARAMQHGKWGFIDRTGKAAIPAVFEHAYGFSEGLASVEQNNKWGFINKNGEWVIEPVFEDAWPFSKGWAEVRQNNQWFLIDKNFKKAFDNNFENVMLFSEGLANAQHMGKWGFINENYEWVIPTYFENVLGFSEGLAAASQNGKWGFINKNAQEWHIMSTFSRVWSFSEGLAKVRTAEGDYGFINNAGEFVLNQDFMKGKYDYVLDYFGEGLLGVGTAKDPNAKDPNAKDSSRAKEITASVIGFS
jgi:hypothetical protein